VKRTNWPQDAQARFFSGLYGYDACGQQAGPDGVTLGSTAQSAAIIVGGAIDGNEYRTSCGGEPLVGRKIALYR
jgi:hypothetical protein